MTTPHVPVLTEASLHSSEPTITDVEIDEAIRAQGQRPADKPFARWKMWVIIIGVILLVLSIAMACTVGVLALIQGSENYGLQKTVQTQGNRHHAEVAHQNYHLSQQNKTIISQNKIIIAGEVIITKGEMDITALITEHTVTLNEIAILQQQVAAVIPIIEGIKPADAQLASLADSLTAAFNQLSGEVTAVCQANHLSCAPTPTLTPP